MQFGLRCLHGDGHRFSSPVSKAATVLVDDLLQFLSKHSTAQRQNVERARVIEERNASNDRAEQAISGFDIVTLRIVGRRRGVELLNGVWDGGERRENHL